jgi:hypothetical protein
MMKKLVAVGVAVVVIIGFVIYLQQVSKADSERARQQALESEHHFNQTMASMQADIDFQNSRIIGYTQGPLAASEYRLCKSSPPKLARNQEKCKQFDEFLKKHAAEQEKHPIW